MNYFDDRENKRAAVEAFTGRSTWDDPFSDFEWAVVDHTLEECDASFDDDGDLFLIIDDSDPHRHSLNTLVERTLSLLNLGANPHDLAEGMETKQRIAAALRSAADRIERG